ncbi:MAG: sulfatase-like hydrolase/transferase, partial [Candidatus Omnitrophica bacterium]|nr:sulfatase-like hydrolase/transferase [Candidatus Omnitrophota bacterium]
VYTASATIEQVEPWLDQHRAGPFFLFVLLLEPHSPYNPPPDHDLFKSDAYPDQLDTGYDLKSGHLKRLAMLGDTRAIERLVQLYDGKIHYVDYYVGRLLQQLEKLGLMNHTIVALTSDHGELLYSHPRDFLTFDHRSLYDPVMHVPLIITGPSVPKGRVVNGLASNVDSAPTLLDLAGLPPMPGAQGDSLASLIQGKKRQLHDYIYGEEDVMVPLRSVRTLHYKLIRNLWDGTTRLFNLDRDPEERYDVAGLEPDVARELNARLEDWMHANQPSPEEQLKRWRLFAQRDKEVITDDQTIGGRLLLIGGPWQSNESPGCSNYGGGCFWAEGGTGSQGAVWRSDNPLIGTYLVSVYYGHPPLPRLATDAPFGVVTDTGSKTVRVDFNSAPGQWHELGTFVNPRAVTLNNAANGIILVDAVKFERIE